MENNNSKKDHAAFVFTDGYGAEGTKLAEVLAKAQDMNVAVTAIAIGHEQSIVQNVYP